MEKLFLLLFVKAAVSYLKRVCTMPQKNLSQDDDDDLIIIALILPGHMITSTYRSTILPAHTKQTVPSSFFVFSAKNICFGTLLQLFQAKKEEMQQKNFFCTTPTKKKSSTQQQQKFKPRLLDKYGASHLTKY